MDNSITIARQNNAVILFNNVLKFGIALSWEKADELAHMLRPSMGRDWVDTDTAVLWQEEAVYIEFKGHVMLRILRSDTEPLKAIRSALIQQARLIEEEEKNEQVTMDGALLMKHGIPLGVTDNKHIQKQIGIEAAHNPELRKVSPVVGVKSQEVFGAPKVLNLGADAPISDILTTFSDEERKQLRQILEEGK